MRHSVDGPHETEGGPETRQHRRSALAKEEVEGTWGTIQSLLLLLLLLHLPAFALFMGAAAAAAARIPVFSGQVCT